MQSSIAWIHVALIRWIACRLAAPPCIRQFETLRSAFAVAVGSLLPAQAVAQVKIYGLREHLGPIKSTLSDAIHECVVEAIGLPIEKRFHRFFLLDRADFLFPADRTDQYTILEIHLFTGRSVETKKTLIRLLFDQLARRVGIGARDLEITLVESPPHNWGIRGASGDELALSYPIEV